MKRTACGGAEIVGLLKTGSAYYAPSSSTVEMVDAVLKDKHKILPCCCYLEGEFGIKDLYVGRPGPARPEGRREDLGDQAHRHGDGGPPQVRGRRPGAGQHPEAVDGPPRGGPGGEKSPPDQEGPRGLGRPTTPRQHPSAPRLRRATNAALARPPLMVAARGATGGGSGGAQPSARASARVPRTPATIARTPRAAVAPTPRTSKTSHDDPPTATLGWNEDEPVDEGQHDPELRSRRTGPTRS